ncbi:6823_t:CDS:10, partial [Cetraspora pellucida]
MSTSTRKTISLPTINEVEGYKTMEALIKFLGDQNIGLDDDDLKILRVQKLVGEVLLSLNVDELIRAGLKLGPAKKISTWIEKIKGEGKEQKLQAGSGVVKFWKKLLDARIIFLIPQDMKRVELNALNSYFMIKDNQICLDKGVIIDSDGILYKNRECTDVRLPSILINSFRGMLCLPDDGPAFTGCTITGTPGIGKTYFDGDVQEGDISLFRRTLKNPNNFLLIDAQASTFKYKAYMILLTSLKVERFNEAVKWLDLQYKNKKNDEGEEFTLELVGELLDKWKKCMNSIDKSGMPTDTISGRLVHLDAYETKTKIDVHNFVASSHEHLMIAGFRGNLFEDYAHLELQRGARKKYYNRPKSKTFALIDSFSLDNKTLDLYQITISKNHGMKIKGLNDLNKWRKDANNFNLYFVVPLNIFETFLLQKYKTTKDEDCKKIPGWINKITQYALEIDFGINKKGDDKNEDSSKKEMDNKVVKKRKMKKSDAMLGDDKIGEASGSNMGSAQHNLKCSRDAVLVENESGETSKKENKKDVKKRNR